jgi:Holliday junction resolvase RusA-like endonuclease
LKYHLHGRIIPKARPRLARNGKAYLPERYRIWKNKAIYQLKQQFDLPRPISKAEISIEVGGKQLGDLDNIAGAVLDALVQAGVLLDDRLSIVSKLTIEHFPDRPLGASIELLNPVRPPLGGALARSISSID